MCVKEKESKYQMKFIYALTYFVWNVEIDL